MKKLIALLLAMVMVLSMVACGNTETPETTKPQAGESQPAENDTPATEPAEEIVLEYWSSWSETENQALVLKAAAESFMAKHPNIKINFTFNGRDNRKLVVSAIEAGTQIDLMDANIDNVVKENIGLIEVMGLAVLPSRLKAEFAALKNAILSHADLRADPVLEKHATWIDEIQSRRTFTEDNTMDILMEETGRVFTAVLEDAGVFKCDEEGRNAFMRFVDVVNR